MVHGGRALARDAQGEIVLVRGGLPGETVIADVERRAGVRQGTVVEVLEASVDRVEALLHPGLDLGFASYEAQLRLKREVVADAVNRAGVPLPGDVPVVRASPRVWGYRSAIQPATIQGRLGYRREGSGDVVVLDDDPTANEALNAAWSTLLEVGIPRGVREIAMRGNDEGEVLIAFVVERSDPSLHDQAHALVKAGITGVALAPFDPRGRFRSGKSRLAGARSMLQAYGDVTLSVSATAFAQPNPGAAGAAFQTLASWLPDGERAVELFAGGGAIALHLTRRYDEVVAVEVAHESVTRGRRDAERLGVTNLRFERGDARRFHLPTADLIVVDPPRAGLAKPLRDALHASDARTLAYVSCDVATWARDVADLTTRGWRVRRMEPFDFQPHTHHLELVSLLER